MSQSDPQVPFKPAASASTRPQTQKQRWVKYGANVALSSVLIVALAGVVTAIAQAHSKRLDTTIGNSQSLKPQTISYIKECKQKIRIVALYPKLKREADEQDLYQPVADLLNDYASKGQNISTEFLDPDSQKEEFEKLVTDLTNRFGGEVKGYKSALESLPAQSAAIDLYAKDESAKFSQLPVTDVQNQDLQQALYIVRPTLVEMSRDLARLKTAVDSDINQEIPSYKEAVDETKKALTAVSQKIDLLTILMQSVGENSQGVPKAIVDYAPDAMKRAAAAKKVVTDALDGLGKLGQLTELDDFRDQLRSRAILVMTDTGYKILSLDQIWKRPPQSQFATVQADVQPRLVFAGEPAITAAIVMLTTPNRPIIIFVRASGPPLTTNEGGGQAVFGAIAQRLKDYNFDVREKDASGQSSAMLETDLTPDKLKSAVWVVVRFPSRDEGGETQLNAELQQHLADGGSAMVMLFPAGDPMDDVLNPWGIKAMTDYVMLHEQIPRSPRKNPDPVDDAVQSAQLFFKLDDYGNHPIATPLTGLDFMTAGSCPIISSTMAPNRITVTPLLPFPTQPHSWAASNAAGVLSQERQHNSFNPNPDASSNRTTGDLDNTPADPLYGAAAAEKPDGQRLMAFGSFWFILNTPIMLPDTDMLEQHGLPVERLPGNSEFFVNSIFWLAHMDSMLAISPHALQVARIEKMSRFSLEFWKIGVLTAGLPAGVVIAGLIVYLRRRD